MALITTPGSASADSYASIAEATEYTAARGLAWFLGLNAQEQALRRATAWIDATYRGKFPGQRQNGRGQSLEWPRKDAQDADGYDIEIDAIPSEIVSATIEAAVRELASPNGLSPDVNLSQSVRSETVGPISVTYAGAAGVSSQRPVLTVVDDILASLIGARTSTKVLLRS